jgi:hypothetical protein
MGSKCFNRRMTEARKTLLGVYLRSPSAASEINPRLAAFFECAHSISLSQSDLEKERNIKQAF